MSDCIELEQFNKVINMPKQLNNEKQLLMATLENKKKSDCCDLSQYMLKFKATSRSLKSIVPFSKPVSAGFMLVRYTFALLGCLGFVSIYTLRVNLSIAIVTMVNTSALVVTPNLSTECAINNKDAPEEEENGEFTWDEPTQGLILGSFYWGYIFTQIPGGRLAEHIGGKWLFGGAALISSVFTLLTPFAARKGASYLIANRIVQGVVQGVTFPAMQRMIAQWAPVNERSRFVSIIFSGCLLGTILGMSLSSYLCVYTGWASVFYVFGAIGIFWFLVWAEFIFENPISHAWISSEEKQYLLKEINCANLSEEKPALPWKEMFNSLPLWAITVSHFGFNWGFYTMLNDLPTYMKTVLHYNIKANGLLSSLPFFISWLCSLLVGVICDKLAEKKYMQLRNARILFNSIGLLFPAALFVGLLFIGCNLHISYAILTIAIITFSCVYGGCQGNHIDIAPNFAGTLMGITNTIATIPGIISPYIVGVITFGQPHQSEWAKVFYITAAIYVFSGIFYILFCKAEEQDWNKAHCQKKEKEDYGTVKIK